VKRKKKKKQFRYFPRITLPSRDFPAERGTSEINIVEISHHKVGGQRDIAASAFVPLAKGASEERRLSGVVRIRARRSAEGILERAEIPRGHRDLITPAAKTLARK